MMTKLSFGKMEKKETKVDFVETELLQPIYRSTVMPMRKGESSYGPQTKTSKILTIALAVFVVSCILSVPLVMFLSNYFSHANPEGHTAAQILEEAVMEKNEKVISEFLHLDERES